MNTESHGARGGCRFSRRPYPSAQEKQDRHSREENGQRRDGDQQVSASPILSEAQLGNIRPKTLSQPYPRCAHRNERMASRLFARRRDGGNEPMAPPRHGLDIERTVSFIPERV